MAGTTRILLYNDALMLCGERFLASLSEDREPRRLLDQVWDSNGVRYCLEQGQWQFAMRAQQIDADAAIDPQFGYNNAFDKPTDWVLTSAVCSDERFNTPLLQYSDEMGYWMADIDPIYVKYVSDDAAYGNDLTLWPATFCDYVAAYFASKVIMKLTSDKEKVAALLTPRTGILAQRLLIAKSRAAMTQPTSFPAQGSWVTSRGGRRGTRRDRGNTGSLTG
ncbi:MAG: hypothetical protein ACYC36_03515 [Bellilinea sp.]